MRSRGTAGSRLVFLALVAVFTAPLAVAVVLHSGVGTWFVPSTVNRAVLLDPPRPVPDERLVLVDGRRLPSDFLDRRWTLVHFAADGCVESCEAVLKAMRQAHQALGRNRTRVQRLLLVPPTRSSPHLLPVGADQPVARATPAWERSLRGAGSGESGNHGGVWLVDPRRFLVSFFPADAGPRAIKKDLGRLVKLSRWQTG